MTTGFQISQPSPAQLILIFATRRAGKAFSAAMCNVKHFWTPDYSQFPSLRWKITTWAALALTITSLDESDAQAQWVKEKEELNQFEPIKVALALLV